jgi:hypothetical protein
MEIKKANTCVCMGCLEPIINGFFAEPQPGYYYHRECVKPEKKPYRDYIANRDKLQAYIKPEPNCDSNIFKTVEERFGPPDLKFHKLDIKVKPKPKTTNMLEIRVLNTKCLITNLQLRITNPSNLKLSELLEGIETQAGGMPTQQVIGDIEAHFNVLSNFLDCAVTYEPGYINIKFGLYHNKILYHLISSWEFKINLKLAKPVEFYYGFGWAVFADIYTNDNNQIDMTVEYEEDNDPNISRYKFLNPQLFSLPIVSNTINANHRIDCLYLTKLPGPVSLINRVKLEMDGIPVLDITPSELIQANKANGIDYPGILIVFNSQVLSTIDNLIRLSNVKKFKIYLNWADPEIKSDGIVANVLATNIFHIRKSSFSDSVYMPEFPLFK